MATFAEMKYLFEKTHQSITSSKENWMGFLKTAGRMYGLSFWDQLSIYAQRPDAIACTSAEMWNEKLQWI